MTKQLGANFGEDVAAAGLGGLPFSWGDTDDSIQGRENLTTAQNTTLDGVVAAHVPTNLDTLSAAEFIGRFTNAEYRAAIATTWRQTAGNAKNWDVVVFDSVIDLNKKKVTTLKTSLVTDGILTQARADAIFQ